MSSLGIVGYADMKRAKKYHLQKTLENHSVTPEMVNAWKETSLPTLLSNYDLKDIYNADEFGQMYDKFYKFMTNKTCQLKSEKCSG